MELENAIGQLEKENSALKIRIELLQKENEKLRTDMYESMQKLIDLAERLEYIEKKTKIHKP